MTWTDPDDAVKMTREERKAHLDLMQANAQQAEAWMRQQVFTARYAAQIGLAHTINWHTETWTTQQAFDKLRAAKVAYERDAGKCDDCDLHGSRRDINSARYCPACWDAHSTASAVES